MIQLDIKPIKSFTFSLPFPPFSVNKSKYKSGRLTTEARKYRGGILSSMQSPSILTGLRNLRKLFNPKKHAIFLEIHFSNPKMYTKEGSISAKSQDIDNGVKIVQDCLTNLRFCKGDFLTKNSKYLSVSKVENLGIDDRFIKNLLVSKSLSSSYSIRFTLHLIKND